MKDKVNNIERLFACGTIIIVLLGLLVTRCLENNIKNANNEVVLTEEEKLYIKDFMEIKDRDAEEIEKDYLRYLENELEEKDEDQKYNIARIKYFLGLNSYLSDEHEKAKEYFTVSKEDFDELNSYFYSLTINNFLMNIEYLEGDYKEAVEISNETYETLKSENININGICSNGLNLIRANSLTGLLKISSSLEMLDTAKPYYDELVELTKNEIYETELSVYAKHLYTLKLGDFQKSEEYALKYMSEVTKLRRKEEIVMMANLPLLNVYIESGNYVQAQKPFDLLYDFYKDKTDEEMYRVLLQIKGQMLVGEKEYQAAMNFYESALKEFEKNNDNENIIKTVELIVGLREEVDIDLNYYVNKGGIARESYNKEKLVGELADQLNLIAYKDLEVEQAAIQEDTVKKEKIIKVSNISRIVYVIIIVLFVLITIKLKMELHRNKKEKKEKKQIKELDSLTIRSSKKYIFEKLQEYIDGENEFILILYDVDELKKINNKYGYRFGTKVLNEILGKINIHIKDKGHAARYGGGEFIVILENNTDFDTINNLIRKDLSEIEYLGENVKITLSAGAVISNGQARKEMLRQVKDMLCLAKANGKNRIEI
ncbi:MAG: diguanylate cyclase domain-containing protein [Sarcina sp.]